MDKRKVHIDEFFARQMDEKAEAPPPTVWDALDKRLDASAGRKKPFPVWWFWAIGGLILISATGIIAGFSTSGNQPAIVNNNAASAKVYKQQKNIANQSTIEKGVKQYMPTESDNKPVDNVMSTQKNTDDEVLDNSQPLNNSTNQQPIAARKHPTDKLYTAPNGRLRSLNKNITNTAAKENVQLPMLPHSKDDVLLLNPKSPDVQVQTVARRYASATTVKLPVVKTILPKGTEERLQPMQTNNSKMQFNAPNASELIASVQPVSMNTEYQSIQPIKTLASVEGSNKQQLLENNKDVLPRSPNATNEIEMVEEAETDKPKVKKKISLPIELGVKAGYSMGFDNSWRANKVAFAPYVSYKLPAGFSLMLQPTYHTGNANTGQFENGEQSYYNVTNSSFDSTGRVVRGVIDSTVLTANPPDTVFRTYTYKQTYDSVYTSYNITQKRLWDIELPLILKYDINKNFTAFVGVSATYSSVLQTEYNEERFSLSREVVEQMNPETFFVTYQGQQPPDGPARKNFDDLFTNYGSPYANYTPRQSVNTNNFMRYGFMIGASYNFNEHWMVDVMLHKTGVDVSAVPDKELQKLYTQPYLRVMLGYRLFKTKSSK